MLIFLHGMMVGFVFLISFGPAFFTILHSSLERGFWKTLFLVAGIFVSDFFYFLLAIWGMSNLIERPEVKWWLAFGGGVVLIAYGIYSILKKAKGVRQGDMVTQDLKPIVLFFKGLFINGFNPFVVVFWLTMISWASVDFEYNANQQVYFFSGMLLTMLILDVTKAYFSNKLRDILTEKLIYRVNVVLGVVFVGFGARLFYYVITNF